MEPVLCGFSLVGLVRFGSSQNIAWSVNNNCLLATEERNGGYVRITFKLDFEMLGHLNEDAVGLISI